MANVDGELSVYSVEINELMNLMEGKSKDRSGKAKELMIKIVNDVYDGKVSIKALASFNEIISKDYSLESTFLRMLPTGLLKHTEILSMAVRCINKPKDIEGLGKAKLFEILSSKSLSVTNDKSYPIKNPPFTIQDYSKYNYVMNRTLDRLREECKDDEIVLEDLDKIEKVLAKRKSEIEKKNQGKKEEEKAKAKADNSTLSPGQIKLIEDINVKLEGNDYQGAKELLSKVTSKNFEKLLNSGMISKDEWMFLLPNKVIEENKDIIMDKIIEEQSRRGNINGIELMDTFMAMKSKVESGLITGGIFGSPHDEPGIYNGYGTPTFTNFSAGLKFLQSNYEEFAKKMNLECGSYEELEEKYKVAVIQNTLVSDYGVSGENRLGEKQDRTNETFGEKEHIQIKNKIKQLGEENMDICCFPIAGYEQPLFVALTKDKDGKEHIRMFNTKGKILDDPKPEIGLNEKGEYVFDENPLEDKITGTNSGSEISLSEIPFENSVKKENGEPVCQFVVPSSSEIKGESIRYGITKGKDGRIEIRMANGLAPKDMLMTLGTAVECYRPEEIALMKKYEEFGIVNEDLTKSVYGLKADRLGEKSKDEEQKEEGR